MGKVTESIFNIGVSDEDIELFENQYKVPNGITYNSYLIKDNKILVMDTVDKSKTEEWLNNLEKELDGKLVDYLVISHIEPDHSGSIGSLVEKYPNITLVGNSKTFSMLDQFFNLQKNVKRLEVKENDTLNIGKYTLQFYMAPMVHWPEVMVTYIKEKKMLFSADSFGKFGVLEIKENWIDEARRYYFSIVAKYGMQVQMLLNKISTLDVKMICPLHGPVLKENLEYYINKYDLWSKYEPEEDGILIVYTSIYGNTEKAAKKMAEILKEKDVNKIVIRNLAEQDIDETVAESFKYSKIILAAPSYNANVFPPMAVFLNKLKERNFQKRKIGLIENGSWAPSAAKSMKEIISKMKDIELVGNTVTIKSSVKQENLKELEELANKII